MEDGTSLPLPPYANLDEFYMRCLQLYHAHLGGLQGTGYTGAVNAVVWALGHTLDGLVADPTNPASGADRWENWIELIHTHHVTPARWRQLVQYAVDTAHVPWTAELREGLQDLIDELPPSPPQQQQQQQDDHHTDTETEDEDEDEQEISASDIDMDVLPAAASVPPPAGEPGTPPLFAHPHAFATGPTAVHEHEVAMGPVPAATGWYDEDDMWDADSVQGDLTRHHTPTPPPPLP